jgi:hypothetical protein
MVLRAAVWNCADGGSVPLLKQISEDLMIEEREVVTREPVTREKETVLVERGSGAGVIVAIAFLIIVVAVLAYLGMLPI